MRRSWAIPIAVSVFFLATASGQSVPVLHEQRQLPSDLEVSGELAGLPPESFAGYIRAPLAKNPHAQMPGNPQYDDATLAALTSYFQTFSQKTKP